jgi:hypothetical protein
MNVLHINQSDIVGGAAIAGYRLHQGLLNQGIHSRLLVGAKIIDSAQAATVPRRYLADRLLFPITKLLSLNSLNFLSTFDLIKHTFYQEVDILNFHNLHGYFNYLTIPKLTENKPAVFTLHDMWSFTGSLHL